MVARLDGHQKRTVLLLAALFALGIGLDLWQVAARRHGGRTWFDSAICSVSRPVQSALLGVARRSERMWLMLVHARELERENVRLAEREAELEAALADAREAEAAACREQGLHAAYSDAAREALLAHVIGLGSDGWSSYVTLDRGEGDGVNVGDVAVARAGVVGQVYAVTGRTARVVPLTDPASGVAVRVQRTRDVGVLRGLGDWRCELRYLEPDAEVLPGDEIVTSGTGGVFPGGLRVGAVTSVGSDPHSSGRRASVEPAAEARWIEEVLVVPGVSSPKEG
jgi:rod shape-determining protein MreC